MAETLARATVCRVPVHMDEYAKPVLGSSRNTYGWKVGVVVVFCLSSLSAGNSELQYFIKYVL